MKARQVTADEHDVIQAACTLTAEMWQQDSFCCMVPRLKFDEAVYLHEKIRRAAGGEGGLGLFAAFDEAGTLQAFTLTKPGRTALMVCRPEHFDEAAAAVLTEARRVKGPGDGHVTNSEVRRRLIALGLPGLSVDESTERIVFD